MNIITLDFETLFDDDYTLKKMTTEAYVRDLRFEALGVGLRTSDGCKYWVGGAGLSKFPELKAPDTAILCHHAAFDGLILSHHYGVRPARFLDTYSMAAFLFGPGQAKGLGALAKRFGLEPKSVPYDKFKGKHWSDLDAATQRELADGCLHDCELTYTIFTRMMKGDY